MQDETVHLRNLLHPPDADSSGNDSEVSVDPRSALSMGRRLDFLVAFLRESFGRALALPVCWIQSHSSVESLRAHKNKRVKDGTRTILAIQANRTPFLDALMSTVTFCAEEEFYLMILPLLFWHGFFVVAKRLTLVVLLGLFAGNVIKDVFELPRPQGVWRPTHDASLVFEFGFPSTHAMNAVTNALLVLYHVWDRDNSKHAMQNNLTFGVLALAHIALLSFSRLYLGAHTATDVRGGLSLGLIVISIFLWNLNGLEATFSSWTPMQTFWICFFGCIVFLLLCPQPRPPTPTFHQNALLAGLAWGLLFGTSLADQYDVSTSIPVESTWVLCIAKTVYGLILMLIVRMIVKFVTVLIFEKLLGIRTQPEARTVSMRSNKKEGRKRIIRLFTRDVDLIAVAVVKTLTYFGTATVITFVVPLLWKDYVVGNFV